MLNRFIKWDGFISIPLTGNKFLVSMNGDIFDSNTGQINPSGKNDIVSIFDGIRFYLLKRSVLVAIVSKLCRVPISKWELLDTLPIDGNDDNVSANNLVWKFPNGGLLVNNKSDFCYVPGFTRYSISRDGTVYSHATNKILSPYQDALGYWMYGCQPDVGKRTIIGMHRLLGLAFLPYPAEVDILDINHIDGKKDNPALSNLEWATRKNNCDHAYSNSLRSDNIEVLTFNPFTNETIEYYSLRDCARRTGMDDETIRLRVKTSGQKIYPPGLLFKKKTDPTEWKVFEDPVAELLKTNFRKPLLVSNTGTGLEHKFNSIKEAADFLGLKEGTLQWKIKNNPSKPIGKYLVAHDLPEIKNKVLFSSNTERDASLIAGNS